MEYEEDYWVEAVDASSYYGRLAVVVFFRRDDTFEAELADYERSLSSGTATGPQPATRRAARMNVDVRPVAGGALRTDFSVSSGGTGTENIAVWTFAHTWPRPVEFHVVVRADSRVIYDASTTA